MIIAAMLSGMVMGVSAQAGHVVSRGNYKSVYIVRPQILVGTYSPFYGPFGAYGYPVILPFGYYPILAPYGFGYSRQTELQKKEDDIRADYQDKIYSVRHDDSLSSAEKKQSIKELKKKRKQDIKDLVSNYHRKPVHEKSQSFD
jgi:hypothetical protein